MQRKGRKRHRAWRARGQRAEAALGGRGLPESVPTTSLSEAAFAALLNGDPRHETGEAPCPGGPLLRGLTKEGAPRAPRGS